MKKYIKIFQDLLNYLSIPKYDKQIIVFIEKKSDLNYFNRFLADLSKSLRLKIVILTSELINISSLQDTNYDSKIIYIGIKILRFLYFKLIDTKIFLMTTPDLENSELKRSINPVKYFYIFHSPISSHSIYNHDAFKYYDYILSAGPHHCKEIKYVDQLYQNKKKNLIPFGYPRILDLKEKYKYNLALVKNKSLKKTILIAPTWGNSSITENCLETLFHQLIKNDFIIIFRPHPISLSGKKDFIFKMKDKFVDKIIFELDVSNTTYLNKIDLLITDWSGFSVEFFLTTKKPTLFIDTPPKIRNKKFYDLELETVENIIRSEIGEVVSLNSINHINKIISRLLTKKYKINPKNYIYDYSKNFENVLITMKKIINEN